MCVLAVLILYTVLRGNVFAVLGFVALPRLLGTVGLWTAIPAAELLTLIIIMLKVYPQVDIMVSKEKF